MENRVPVTAIESVIVVGTGLAGLRTTSALRTQGFTGTITVIGTEPHLPYDRPPLSKKLLAHSEPVFLHDDLGVLLHDLTPHVLTHHTVTSVRLSDESSGSQRSAITVEAVSQRPDHDRQEDDHLEHTKIFTADALVLAVGSSPRIPAHWAGTHTLYTWEDAVKLRSALESSTNQNVVIIGAGWIGAELATVAKLHGHSVTVVEAQSTALAVQLGHDMGARVSTWYQEFGVNLMTATSVNRVSIQPNSQRLITLDSGQTLSADIVITAIGAAPSTSWLPEDFPRNQIGAIKTDQWGRVHVPGHTTGHLFAVGDCAEREDAQFTTVPGGHWNIALQDPERIAAAITGATELPRTPAPQVFSTQLGREINLFGLPNVHQDAVHIRPGVTDNGQDWVGLYVNESPNSDVPEGKALVTGIFTVNSPRLASQARKLMASGPALLDLNKALDPAVQLRAAL